MIEIIPNWHPIWVHFAVALLTTSAGLFLIFGWQSSQASIRANALIVARWTLRLGVIAAIGALLTGYLASGSVTHNDVSHANMMVHRNWAFAATAIFTIVALVDYTRRNESRVSVLSILLLVTGSITLAVTGLEGAENVYQYGLGVQRLPDLSSQQHSGGEETAAHGHEDTTGESHETATASQASEQSEHEHDQPSTDNSQNTTADDGHTHSHSEVSETVDTENTVNDPGHDDGHAHSQADVPAPVEIESAIEDSNHPASLLATNFANAIATGAIDTLRSVVAADVMIFESGGIESSLAEYERHHMPADMAFMKAMRREVLSRQVIDSGDSATVATRSRIHGVYKGREIDQTSTETLVMKRVNGEWKIVHIHWSSS